MAKSRRRRSVPRGTRGKRVRKDWVYRPNIHSYGTGLGGVSTDGTYSSAVGAISSGFQSSIARVLYDSHNWMSFLGSSGVAQPGVLGAAARAEGKRATMYAVNGVINLVPDTWALGSQIRVGWRILIADQDLPSGLAVLDADYSMWNDPVGAAGTESTAAFRNDHRCLAEGRVFRNFSTSNDQADLRIFPRWRGRWMLQEHQAMYMYLEIEGNSGGGPGVGMRFQMWMRSLVSDD